MKRRPRGPRKPTRPPELDKCLREIQTLRNDPELAVRLLEFAEQDQVDAQYALGLVYAEGRGIPEDLARAFYWLSRAIANGDQEAHTLRNIIGAQMTEDQYQASQRMINSLELKLV